MKKVSDRVFAIEVDGRRLNVSVECLKPAYFAAQQDERAAVDELCTSSSRAIINGTTLVEKASFHPEDLYWRTTMEGQMDCDFPRRISP